MSLVFSKQDVGGGPLSDGPILSFNKNDEVTEVEYINSCNGGILDDPASPRDSGIAKDTIVTLTKEKFCRTIFSYLNKNDIDNSNNNLQNTIVILRNINYMNYKIYIKLSDFSINKEVIYNYMKKLSKSDDFFVKEKNYIILKNEFYLNNSINNYSNIELEIKNIIKNISEYVSNDEINFLLYFYKYGSCFSTCNTIKEIIN